MKPTTNEPMFQWRQHLKNLLKENGMTVREFAKMMDVGEVHAYKWLSGAVNMKINRYFEAVYKLERYKK